MTEQDILGFDPQDLFSQNENQQTQQYAGNPNVYKMKPADSVDDDGIYRATIKVVYNPFDRHKSFLDQQSYGLKDSKGFFSVISSLTNGDKSCPIFTAWKKCRYAKQKDGTFNSKEDEVLWKQQAKIEENGKALFDKRQARYCVVQILEDRNQPDLVGSFKLWKIPSSIYTLIQQKSKPTDSKKAAIPVMDYLFGRSFDIEVNPGPDDPQNPTRKTREIVYLGELSEDEVSCINPDGSPLLTSDEQKILNEYISSMKKVWKSKDPDERTALLNVINEDENTIELRKIYARVMEQIKTWCPNIDQLGYTEWDEKTTNRVNSWIDIVLSGGDPERVTSSDNSMITEDNGSDDSPSTATVEAAETTSSTQSDETGDLPF